MSSPDLPTRATVAPDPFLDRGVLASVSIGDHAEEGLHAHERELVRTMAPQRRATFAAGRQALRAAIAAVAPSHADHPLLQTLRGAPQLPPGITGSISHKRTRAVAIAAPSSGELVGVDLEARPNAADAGKLSISDRILTSAERDAIAHLDALAHREATLIRFAIKEAIYKAIDPYVQRYVRFTEVELDVRTDGTALARLMLPELPDDEVTVESHWRLDDTWIIAMARSRRR